MTNGPDRRRTDTDAARRRRRQLQHCWEASHSLPVEHPSEQFAQALGALVESAHRLPVCDRSARLHAAVNRLADASDRTTACVAARAVVTASKLALDNDPWFRFHRAAADAVATLCEAA